MSSNICNRCKKNFKFPYLLKRHNERIFPCIERDSTKSSQNNPKIIPKQSQNNPKKIKKVEKNQKKDKFRNQNMTFQCLYCKEKFNSKNSLYKHKNELRCKKMPLKEINKIKLLKNNKVIKKKLEAEKQLAIKSSNNTITTFIDNSVNKTIKNNIINNFNVKLSIFGNENTDFLTKKDKLTVVNRCYMGVPALIQKIHSHPENRNFFISNIRNGIMGTLNKNYELEYQDYQEICDKLIEKNMDRLDDYFNEFQDELKESVKQRMKTVISLNQQGKLTDKYIEDIKFYLMNISKKNKKDIHHFIDNIEKQIKIKN